MIKIYLDGEFSQNRCGNSDKDVDEVMRLSVSLHHKGKLRIANEANRSSSFGSVAIEAHEVIVLASKARRRQFLQFVELAQDVHNSDDDYEEWQIDTLRFWEVRLGVRASSSAPSVLFAMRLRRRRSCIAGTAVSLSVAKRSPRNGSSSVSIAEEPQRTRRCSGLRACPTAPTPPRDNIARFGNERRRKIYWSRKQMIRSGVKTQLF